MEKSPLIDNFQRKISYLRISVTDRCNFRCVYCMAEDMTFQPRANILSLEEIVQVARNFVALGVDKIRITGGEPLIRSNILWLFEQLGQMAGLKDILITTNGARLNELAQPLRDAGVTRLNISIDSLQPERFRQITRTGDLTEVLSGIEAAQKAGFEAIKLNAVILKGHNDDEILPLVEFARRQGLDISFIEEMPLGEIDSHSRADAYLSSDELRGIIEQRYPLTTSAYRTGGPSVYYQMADSPSRVGFISPHSHNFCATCNRVRVTAEGRLLLCLGNEHSVDLRQIMRDQGADDIALQQAISQAMSIKPERHYFDLDESPEILRFMNTTGG